MILIYDLFDALFKEYLTPHRQDNPVVLLFEKAMNKKSNGGTQVSKLYKYCLSYGDL